MNCCEDTGWELWALKVFHPSQKAHSTPALHPQPQPALLCSTPQEIHMTSFGCSPSLKKFTIFSHLSCLLLDTDDSLHEQPLHLPNSKESKPTHRTPTWLPPSSFPAPQPIHASLLHAIYQFNRSPRAALCFTPADVLISPNSVSPWKCHLEKFPADLTARPCYLPHSTVNIRLWFATWCCAGPVSWACSTLMPTSQDTPAQPSTHFSWAQVTTSHCMTYLPSAVPRAAQV